MEAAQFEERGRNAQGWQGVTFRAPSHALQRPSVIAGTFRVHSKAAGMASASSSGPPSDGGSDSGSVTSAVSAASNVVPTEAEVARANELKGTGNEFFKAKRFGSAVKAYTEAIELNPTAVLFGAQDAQTPHRPSSLTHTCCATGNRAFANLKMENFGLAISDAEKALELDETYIKVSPASTSALCTSPR